MELMNIEEIHKRYEAYMDGYHLSGSYGVWIPFFKVTLQMDYLYETDLKMVEDFICRCIERGVVEKSKIMFVLALEEEVFNVAVEQLISSNYLKESQINNQINYNFTDIGKRLIKKRMRHEIKKMFTEWYYDGLSDQYKLDFFSTSHQHRFKKFKEIEKIKNQIIISPLVFPKYESDLHFQLLARQTLEKIEEIEQAKQEEISSKKIVNIEHFELLTDREVYYHEYRILLFRNDNGEFKLLAHDLCGEKNIDQQVTESIRELADDGYFTNLIVDDSEKVSIDEILIALKSHAYERLSPDLETITDDKKNILLVKQIDESILKTVGTDNSFELEKMIELKEETEETSLIEQVQIREYRQSLENIEQLQSQAVAIEYIMNYKIREQFIGYLKNAKKSLYIISPWMNNYIINNEFKHDLEKLLQRGVKVRIICGITDHMSDQQDFRDLNTQKIAKELIRIAEPYKDLFKLKFGQTHEKLLICDDLHYINGSFNFLSYSGEDDKFFRNEGSTYCQNQTLIQETIKLRFEF